MVLQRVPSCLFLAPTDDDGEHDGSSRGLLLSSAGGQTQRRARACLKLLEDTFTSPWPKFCCYLLATIFEI